MLTTAIIASCPFRHAVMPIDLLPRIKTRESKQGFQAGELWSSRKHTVTRLASPMSTPSNAASRTTTETNKYTSKRTMRFTVNTKWVTPVSRRIWCWCHQMRILTRFQAPSRLSRTLQWATSYGLSGGKLRGRSNAKITVRPSRIATGRSSSVAWRPQRHSKSGVPFRVRLRELQSLVAGGLSDEGPYRRDRNANKATNHAQTLLGDAWSGIDTRQVMSGSESARR